MKQLLPLVLAALPACTAVPAAPVERIIPAEPPPERIEWGFDKEATEYALLTSARAEFGETAVLRALAARTYLITKHYPGMRPPPPPDAGPNWRYPEPPTAMLIRESGGWLAATATGFRAARAEAVARIEAILADRAFWAEPEWAQPGCTDSGASLLMLKVPGRAEIIRRPSCGETGRGEKLVFAALAA
ncbi:MAG TPA: hypothetical protein VNH53_09315 [Sphingomicrobium sp.]|jgi:hypothetical protein|nr:hypothetical protein [Sphingomicrobium sp.]